MKQSDEIKTIRERNLKLKLSDDDVKRISEKAGSVGMTVSELLESFLGDLVDGTYSNGSDERMYANSWFDRCGFSWMADNTFLKFLIDFDIVSDTVEDWNELKWYEGNVEELERDRRSYDDTIDRINENYSSFIEQISDQEKPKIEDEMKIVIKWWDEYLQLQGDELPK